MMDNDTFQERLDACGTDLSTWEAQDRREAEALLDRSAQARAALSAAERLDALLGGAMAQERAGDPLKAGILAIPSRHPRAAGTRSRWGGLVPSPWRAGMAAATVALLVGVYTGASSPALFEGAFGTRAAEAELSVAVIAFGTGIDVHEDMLP